MSDDALLQTLSLSKSYGGIHAVHDVDFSIGRTERICIIGPNGAGKSTLLGMLSGTLSPTSGDIRVSDVGMVGCEPHEFCRRGVVRKFQGTNTFQWLTVRDNLVVAGMAVANHLQREIPDPEEVLELIKLRPQADMTAETISHGQRQWLEVGMTLMCRPKLLLLDEPTAGMTVEGTREMAELIHRLQGRFAIIVIEHDLAFVRSLRCRTLVMHQGTIIRDGSFEDIERDPLVHDVYLGRGGRRAAN
jgi:ABC-type uncharacterized transport system ATPase subunit